MSGKGHSHFKGKPVSLGRSFSLGFSSSSFCGKTPPEDLGQQRPSLRECHRLEAVVPLINLIEPAACMRLFNLEVLPLVIAGVIQQLQSPPEAHLAPPAGEGPWHHHQRFPTASLAPQKSWSLSPGMQRIILTKLSLLSCTEAWGMFSAACPCCAEFS